MSGAARKKRVGLLAGFAIIFIIIFTVWEQPETVADIWSPSSGPFEQDLELQRARESQDLIRHLTKDEQLAVADPPEYPSERLIQDHELQDGISKAAASSITQPVVGKITISFGEPEEVYERAIRSHESHNKAMGYTQFVLRERLVPGLWSKHAYIFSVIVQEMAKPEGQRLKWLMFVTPKSMIGARLTYK